jgi:hypothetical protein
MRNGIVEFANRDHSEHGFLIPVHKCVERTAVACTILTRAVQGIRKENNDLIEIRMFIHKKKIINSMEDRPSLRS